MPISVSQPGSSLSCPPLSDTSIISAVTLMDLRGAARHVGPGVGGLPHNGSAAGRKEPAPEEPAPQRCRSHARLRERFPRSAALLWS